MKKHMTHAETVSAAHELERRDATVFRQTEEIFDILTRSLSERAVLQPEALLWSKEFAQQFILSRLDRADDMGMPELREAQELSHQVLGEHVFPFLMDCMDGREMPVIELSYVPHTGAFMRTAGADIRVIKEGLRPGTVLIEDDSYKIRRINGMLKAHNQPGAGVDFSWISHFHCAARGRQELRAAGVVLDGGLAADIKRKFQLAQGVDLIRQKAIERGEMVGEARHNFFSFNPEDGTITMGLEIYAENVGKDGYTDDVLETLYREGKIVNSWMFLEDPNIVSELQAIVKPADFRNRFAPSLRDNWLAISELYRNGEGNVFKTIRAAIEDMYTNPEAGFTVGSTTNLRERQISTGMLDYKAKLLLQNLVTRWSVLRDKREGWPYDKHQEQGIVWTEGGFGPFAREIDMFAIYPYGDILEHTRLAVEILRNARKEGKIKDKLGRLSGSEFARAPLVIINKEILRTVTAQGWEQIRRIQWSDYIGSINWDDPTVAHWDRSHIAELVSAGLIGTGNVPLRESDREQLVSAMFELFNRMRTCMQDAEFKSDLLNGRIIIVSVFVDRDRRAKAILPIMPIPRSFV